MTRLLHLSIVALAALLVLTSCGKDEVSLDPPEITYGEDISEMGMFVVDPRYTVAALPPEGDWILFDDIGELLKYHDRIPGTEFRATWVNDYYTEEWLPAEEAIYLQSGEFNSPMGWMVAAFANEDEARAFQDEHGGELMTWEEADAQEWTDPPAPDSALHGGTPHATPDPQSTPVSSHDGQGTGQNPHHHPAG